MLINLSMNANIKGKALRLIKGNISKSPLLLRYFLSKFNCTKTLYEYYHYKGTFDL